LFIRLQLSAGRATHNEGGNLDSDVTPKIRAIKICRKKFHPNEKTTILEIRPHAMHPKIYNFVMDTCICPPG